MGNVTLVSLTEDNKVYPLLDQDENIVGRSIIEANDVNIFDSTNKVSKRHCLIERKEGGYTIKDLDSDHGTYVNEKKIKESPLKNGDRLGLGLRYILKIKVEGAGLTFAE